MGRTIIRVAVVAAAVLAGLAGSGEIADSQSPSPGGEAGSSDWRVVDAGGQHTCGIRSTGRLYCWGLDIHGQVGDGGDDADVPTPTEVAGGHTDWTHVSAGSFHTCGRRANGRLYCWGSDGDGQLGTAGLPADRTTPTAVSGGVTTWTHVSVGRHHTCGRRSTGRLYCWGRDDDGQLGDGGANNGQIVPFEVAGGATNWASVTAGWAHTCGRRANGRLFCWGSDSDGQLGTAGLPADRSTPAQVSGGVTTWAQVDAGGHHTCGRRTNGRLFCWGDDAYGQLGDGGATVDQIIATQVDGDATNWTSVSVGTAHTCGRRSTGRLYCWGDNSVGQVGDGTFSGPWIPSEVAGQTTDWTLVSAGGNHTCGRITSGRLFCWGDRFHRQLGDGLEGLGGIQRRPIAVAR